MDFWNYRDNVIIYGNFIVKFCVGFVIFFWVVEGDIFCKIKVMRIRVVEKNLEFFFIYILINLLF